MCLSNIPPALILRDRALGAAVSKGGGIAREDGRKRPNGMT
jgi:hypothetical protein